MKPVELTFVIGIMGCRHRVREIWPRFPTAVSGESQKTNGSIWHGKHVKRTC
jgi:hypothetical protein